MVHIKRLNEMLSKGINLPNIHDIDSKNGTFIVTTEMPNRGKQTDNVVWEVKPMECNKDQCVMNARVLETNSNEFSIGDNVYITVQINATVEDVAAEIIDTWTNVYNSIMSNM